MLQLVLASQSPRRREILSNAGYKFHVCPVNVSETLDKNLTLDDAIQRLAVEKAEAFVEGPKPPELKDYLLVTADTLVCLDGGTLGKPVDEAEAWTFLRALSGRRHEVKTAMCFWEMPKNFRLTVIETTGVEFHKLSDEMIREYVATGDPFDKAGAYGIQGIGGKFVAKYDGSFRNVMGLPIELFQATMEKYGWSKRI